MLNLSIANEVAEGLCEATFDGRMFKDLLMRDTVGVMNPEARLLGVPWASKIVADQRGLRACNLNPAPTDGGKAAFE